MLVITRWYKKDWFSQLKKFVNATGATPEEATMFANGLFDKRGHYMDGEHVLGATVARLNNRLDVTIQYDSHTKHLMI